MKLPTPNIEIGPGDLFATYQNEILSTRHLFQNAPPEYFPLLGLGLLFLFLCTLLIILETRKHARYLTEEYFKLSSRVIMILSAFWLFSFTNFIAMIVVRGDVFLHFISNVYESACLLAFYDCILLHCKALGEVFDGRGSVSLQVPPCCCCLPQMATTKRNLKWLRFAIIQAIFLQTLVEFIKTLAVLDSSFDPEAVYVVVSDVVVLLSFVFAMWAVFVVVRGRRAQLNRFKYLQKFAMFKLMIIVQKFFYEVLSFIAKESHIPGYKSLSGKTRCVIWVDAVTVVVSTVLLFVVRKFFDEQDYEVLKQQNDKDRYVIDTGYGTINLGKDDCEKNVE